MCLAFRKTFVAAFKAQYELESYSDIAGTIKLRDHRRLIIQVDSLPRLDMNSYPELLIVDELESILSKLISCHNAAMVVQNFMQLIKYSGTVICMDGLMEPRSIEFISWIKNTTIPQIVYNDFNPRVSYTMDVFPYNKKMAQYVADLFLAKCNETGTDGKPKNIYGMITSNTLCRFVCDFLKANDISVLCYHGDND